MMAMPCTLLSSVHGMAIIPGLYRKLPFDPLKDFIPVSQLTSSFIVLVANPRLPASTVKEVVALAKAQPGKLNYGSTGLGAPPHLTMEIFKSATGTDILHVPYKGDAFQIPALLAGEVQLAFTPLPAALGHAKAGKLRILGMTGTRRSAEIPDVPTMAEAGVPDFVVTGWLGLFAPAGTPRDIVNRISSDTARIVNQSDIRDRLPGWGYEPVGNSPEEFAKKYREDVATYTKAIQTARVPQLE
jgi:tripartite-type tricarboxylate transporter receptor subunit TctC